MNSLFRPSLSVSRPNTSAPTTSPKRYTEPSRPTWPLLSARVPFSCRVLPIAETIWISRPSRIHADPRPTTIIQWNRVHGRRSIRAGTRLRTTPGVSAIAEVINRSPDVVVEEIVVPLLLLFIHACREAPSWDASGEGEQPVEGGCVRRDVHLRAEHGALHLTELRRDGRTQEGEPGVAGRVRRRPRQVEGVREVPPVHEVLAEHHREDGGPVHHRLLHHDPLLRHAAPHGPLDPGRRVADDVPRA